MSATEPIREKLCVHCGKPVIYLAAIGRTVDAASVVYERGMDGMVYDRRRGRFRRATDVLPEPARCNLVHYCDAYYVDKRRGYEAGQDHAIAGMRVSNLLREIGQSWT